MMEISFAPRLRGDTPTTDVAAGAPVCAQGTGSSGRGELDQERMARVRGSPAKGSRSRVSVKHRHMVTPL